MNVIKPKSTTTVAYQKLWMLHDNFSPAGKAIAFLEASYSIVAGFQSKLSRRPDMQNACFLDRWERFTSVLALELLEDMPINPRILNSLKAFIMPTKYGVPFNFFVDQDTSVYPDDVDDTALATLGLYTHGLIDKPYYEAMVDRVISNVNKDGVIQTYLSPRGTDGREDRICPVVCANAMRLVYSAGKRHLALKTEEYLYLTLTQSGYMEHFEFYCSPDTFLYFLAKAIQYSPEAKAKFHGELVKHVLRRLGCSRSPLEAALRILAVAALQVLEENINLEQIESDVMTVRKSQRVDGSWANEQFMKGNRANIYLGSEALTTLFAVRALHATQDLF